MLTHMAVVPRGLTQADRRRFRAREDQGDDPSAR